MAKPKADQTADTAAPDTTAPAEPMPSTGDMVRVTVLPLGNGKISTGKHVGGEGEVYAREDDILEVDAATAHAQHKAGLVKIIKEA